MSDPQFLSPAERMQAVALAAHRIADRFPSHEEGFCRRLKETAMDLIEDIAVFGVAKTRDAAGTNRLLHQILAKTEALKALFSFVKLRGYVPAATIDIVLWHVAQLSEYFQKEDALVEHHIASQHPHGVVVSGTFSDIETKPKTTQASLSTPSRSYDPLLGPDGFGFSKPAVASAVMSVDHGRAWPDRQKRILDFFALHRRAPLKELLTLFPGISEKTVRNDLTQLCQQGNLRRVGLAPRSHYVLTA